MKELSDLEIQQALELMKQYPPERIEQERLRAEAQIKNEALRKQVLEEFTSAALEGTKAELEANERPMKALQNIENAVYKHKNSTDKAIGIHEKQLTELEIANQSLRTQLDLAFNEIEKQKVSNVAQEKINKKNKRRMNIQFVFMILSFCISLITAITNPNVQKFVLSFF
jgi:hypothetical protein